MSQKVKVSKKDTEKKVEDKEINYDDDDDDDFDYEKEEKKETREGCMGCLTLIVIAVIVVLFLRGDFGDSEGRKNTSNDPDVVFNGNQQVAIALDYRSKLLTNEPTLKVVLNDCELGTISEGKHKEFVVNLNAGEKYTLKIIDEKSVLQIPLDKVNFKVTENEYYFVYEIKNRELVDDKSLQVKS